MIRKNKLIQELNALHIDIVSIEQMRIIKDKNAFEPQKRYWVHIEKPANIEGLSTNSNNLTNYYGLLHTWKLGNEINGETIKLKNRDAATVKYTACGVFVMPIYPVFGDNASIAYMKDIIAKTKYQEQDIQAVTLPVIDRERERILNKIKDAEKCIEQYSDMQKEAQEELLKLKEAEDANLWRVFQQNIGVVEADKRVESIRMINDTLYVRTNEIKIYTDVDIEDKPIYADMGQYTIAIDNKIKIYGDMIRGRCHPHVDTGGDPCLGEIGDTVYKLHSLRDYISTITMLLDFLESYNRGGEYERLSYWVKDEAEREEVNNFLYNN
jgi:hypothetical protein